jgi:hydroxymethylpyrimidine pyrophosphatase-like HAD family hydrolase
MTSPRFPATNISAVVSDVDGTLVTDDNAGPEVRRAADFVTDSNRDEGFAKAIERFILSRARSNAQLGVARAGGDAW